MFPTNPFKALVPGHDRYIYLSADGIGSRQESYEAF